MPESLPSCERSDLKAEIQRQADLSTLVALAGLYSTYGETIDVSGGSPNDYQVFEMNFVDP